MIKINNTAEYWLCHECGGDRCH